MKKLGLLAALLLPFSVSALLLAPLSAQSASKKRAPSGKKARSKEKKIEGPLAPEIETRKDVPPPPPVVLDDDGREDRGGKVY